MQILFCALFFSEFIKGIIFMQNEKKSIAMLFLTTLIWGFAFVAQRVGADYVGVFTFNGVRFALGALSLIPVIRVFEKDANNRAKTLKTVKVGIAAGLILFTASNLQQYGVYLTHSSSKAGFITGLYIILVPILGIFLKQNTSLKTWVGAIFALLGMYFLSITDGFKIELGDLALVLGSVFWAMHILIIDYFSHEIYSLRFALTQFSVCAALCIIIALFREDITVSGMKGALVPILYGGILSVGVAYTLQIVGQKNVNPTLSAIIFSTESIFSAIGGALLLGESLTQRGYFGCALMFFGHYNYSDEV